MEPKKYHNIRLLKAWDSTWEFIKEKKIYEIPSVIIATIVHIVVSHKYYDILIALGYEIVGLLIMFVLLFLWKSLRTVPENIYDEQQKTIKLLKKEILSLKGQCRPKLSVKFKRGESPWFQEDQSEKLRPTYNKGLIYTYRIGLMNLGLETIKEINVRLTEIKPHPQGFHPPCFLGTMHNEPNNLQMTKIPEDGRFIDVFYFYRSFDGKNEEMGICHTVNSGRKIPVQPYEIDITVTSDNGGDSIATHFQFDPNQKDAKYCMEMIN